MYKLKLPMRSFNLCNRYLNRLPKVSMTLAESLANLYIRMSCSWTISPVLGKERLFDTSVWWMAFPILNISKYFTCCDADCIQIPICIFSVVPHTSYQYRIVDFTGLCFVMCILLARIFVRVLDCTTFISCLFSSTNCMRELDNNFIAVRYRDLGHRMDASLESCKFITNSKRMLKQHILEITAAWETSAQITFAKQFSDSLEVNITFNNLEQDSRRTRNRDPLRDFTVLSQACWV